MGGGLWNMVEFWSEQIFYFRFGNKYKVDGENRASISDVHMEIVAEQDYVGDRGYRHVHTECFSPSVAMFCHEFQHILQGRAREVGSNSTVSISPAAEGAFQNVIFQTL